MKIRFKNHFKKPLPNSPSWIQWSTRYPFIFLIPVIGFTYLGWYMYSQLQLLENDHVHSTYIGKLKIIYDVLGKEGVLGSFLMIATLFLYLFWYYALSE
jgi:hypothetical protein